MSDNVTLAIVVFAGVGCGVLLLALLWEWFSERRRSKDITSRLEGMAKGERTPGGDPFGDLFVDAASKDVKWMQPGKPELLRIDLWSTANVFERGHKVALHVTSSNAPRFEVNPNTGHAPGEEVAEPRVARNTIHHDGSHPSALRLPVLAETPATATASSGGSR